MKKIFFVFILISSFSVFSQKKIKSNINLNEVFKKEISKKLLRKIKLNNQEKVVLYFQINKEKKPYNFRFSFRLNDNLKKNIEDIVKNYPLNSLIENELDSKKRYSIPILSKKGKKVVFNDNLKVIEEIAPSTNSCSDLNYYQDINSCFIYEVKNHIKDKLSETDKTYLKDKNINLIIQFRVTKQGLIFDKNSSVPNKLRGKIIYILKQFPALTQQPLINNKFNPQKFRVKIYFDEKDVKLFDEVKQVGVKELEPDSENSLSKYFKSKLTDEDLSKLNLNRINKRLSVSFELNKNDEMINLTTSSRSDYLDKKIKTIFKEYPFEDLQFISKRSFSNYFIHLILFEGNIAKIKANSKVGIESVPIFPGCKSSKSLRETKRCFSRGVQRHFAKSFNADLPSKLGLSNGRKRIIISFIVDTNGKATKIYVETPHLEIEKEVLRVMNKLPIVTPGEQNGRKVKIKYSIPFTIIVQ